MKKAKRADKPGSVVDDHLSRLHVTVQFFARYPSAGRADPWRSYSRLLRKGLAKPPCCHDAGGLLHHRFSFSLTRHKTSSGSLLFCGANPSGCPAWPLASFLPYGARTFLTPATRAGRAIVWPASRGGIVPCGRRSCERTGLRPCSNSPGLARRPHGAFGSCGSCARKMWGRQRETGRDRGTVIRREDDLFGRGNRLCFNAGNAHLFWALADVGPVVRGYG